VVAVVVEVMIDLVVLTEEAATVMVNPVSYHTRTTNAIMSTSMINLSCMYLFRISCKINKVQILISNY